MKQKLINGLVKVVRYIVGVKINIIEDDNSGECGSVTEYVCSSRFNILKYRTIIEQRNKYGTDFKYFINVYLFGIEVLSLILRDRYKRDIYVNDVCHSFKPVKRNPINSSNIIIVDQDKLPETTDDSSEVIFQPYVMMLRDPDIQKINPKTKMVMLNVVNKRINHIIKSNDLQSYHLFKKTLKELCLFYSYNTEEYPATVRSIIFENREKNLEKQKILVNFFIRLKCVTASDVICLKLKDYVKFIRNERKKLFPNIKYKEHNNKFISKSVFLIKKGVRNVMENSAYNKKTELSLYVIAYIDSLWLTNYGIEEKKNQMLDVYKSWELGSDMIPSILSGFNNYHFDVLYEYLVSENIL